ncbi:MAG TPA: RloB family protein [bacterium]|nr:RloB family protein [bacterium]
MKDMSSRKRKKLRNRTAFLPLKPLILILCEGEKTEPYYFEDIKRAWNLTSMDVRIIGSDECGTAPKGIVEHAKKEFNKLAKGKLEIKKEDVWCVFDRDDHPSFDEAVKMAVDNGFGAAASNPCFELWYLLHFQDQTAHIDRHNVARILKYEWIPGYAKNMKGLFIELESRLEAAAQRSVQLREKHAGDGNRETCNPSTGVDRLISRLSNIREKPSKISGCV